MNEYKGFNQKSKFIFPELGEDISVTERFDQDVLSYIVKNKKIYSKYIPKDKIEEGARYLKRSINGMRKITYRQTEGMGRYYPLGIGLGSMKRELRHTICGHLYNDIDMVNAGPSILKYICQKNGYEHKYLAIYIKMRDSLIVDSDLPRSKVKNLFMIPIYGSRARSELKNSFEKEKLRDFVDYYIDEIEQIRDQLCSDNINLFGKFEQVCKQTDQDKIIESDIINNRDPLSCLVDENGKKFPNYDGRFLRAVIMSIENELLMTAYKFYGEPAECVLCYDGLMIPKNIDPKIKKLEEHLNEKFGIDLKWKNKAMDEGFRYKIPSRVPKHADFSTFIQKQFTRSDEGLSRIFMNSANRSFKIVNDRLDCYIYDNKKKIWTEKSKHWACRMVGLQLEKEIMTSLKAFQDSLNDDDESDDDDDQVDTTSDDIECQIERILDRYDKIHELKDEMKTLKKELKKASPSEKLEERERLGDIEHEIKFLQEEKRKVPKLKRLLRISKAAFKKEVKERSKTKKQDLKEAKAEKAEEEAVVNTHMKKVERVLTSNVQLGILNNLIAHSGIEDYKFVENLNTRKEFLPIKHGMMIHLRNGEIMPRNTSDLWSFECPVNYRPDFDRKAVETFVLDIVGTREKMKVIQTYLGYVLTGETIAKILHCWLGDQNNGKGTLNSLVMEIMGDLSATINTSVILKDKNGRSAGQASPDLFRLIGKRLWSISELPDNGVFDDAQIKRLAGESDEVTYRPLYNSESSFRPMGKFILQSQHFPSFNLSDKALRGRIVPIWFPYSFVDEPEAENEKLKDPAKVDAFRKNHLDDFFSWMVEGAIRFYKAGITPLTGEMKQKRDEIFGEDNSIQSFVDECVEYNDPEKHSLEKFGNEFQDFTFKHIYEEYVVWCGMAIKARGFKEFCRVLRSTVPKHRIQKNKAGTIVVGIRIKQ